MIAGEGFPAQSTETPTFSESQLLVMVVATWASVLVALDVPLPLGLAALGLAVVRWSSGVRKTLVAFGLVLVASALSASAEKAYVLAAPRTLEREPATMITDTEPSDFGWRAEARLDRTRQRVRLVGVGFQRPDLVAGQPVWIDGRLKPGDENAWVKSRHLVGVVSSAHVVDAGDVAWWRRPGEWLRAGVLGATDSFGGDQAALYHGLVVGDDRFQSEGQRAQFRAAGLSHLLAVSGQNVAFLLAVLAPLTARVRPSVGLALIAAALVVFALATRLEPSVLRATATAAVSTVATMRSARSAGLRSLAIAVIGLLLIDPFLAWSVGFQLSVGASAGILLLGPLIRSRVRGPGWIADPVSITLAAQIGVSPILLIVFGPVATVTIPANLLAGWAAGAVMTLGLSVGLFASLLPPTVGAMLQMPSRVLVWWIDAVAAEAAAAPLPVVSSGSVRWIFAGGLLVWWLRPARWLSSWWVVPLAGLIVLASETDRAVDGWFERTATTPSVLVIEDPSQRWVEIVVGNRIRSIDVVVVADGGWATSRTIRRLRDVADIGVVLAPGDHRIVGGRRVLDDHTLEVDGGWLIISVEPKQLVIDFAGNGVVPVADQQLDG